MVDHVVGEVVALLRRARRIDLMIVVNELGVVLVGLAAHESVEALEARDRAATCRAGSPSSSRSSAPGATCRRRRSRSSARAGSPAESRSPSGSPHRSRGSRSKSPRCGPCRWRGDSARSSGTRASASRATWCGSSSSADRRRRGDRTSASRGRIRSSRAARSPRRRARRSRCSARLRATSVAQATTKSTPRRFDRSFPRTASASRLPRRIRAAKYPTDRRRGAAIRG